MRSFLDMQVEERKKIGEFEKTLNSEQAKIWNMDAQRYYEQEREVSEKVKYNFLIFKS